MVPLLTRLTKLLANATQPKPKGFAYLSGVVLEAKIDTLLGELHRVKLLLAETRLERDRANARAADHKRMEMSLHLQLACARTQMIDPMAIPRLKVTLAASRGETAALETQLQASQQQCAALEEENRRLLAALAIPAAPEASADVPVPVEAAMPPETAVPDAQPVIEKPAAPASPFPTRKGQPRTASTAGVAQKRGQRKTRMAPRHAVNASDENSLREEHA